jgi:hypothetical protein
VKSRNLAILVVASCAAGATPAVAGAPVVNARPLPNDRSAVVVAWRPRAATAVVALRSGGLLAVHSLRPVLVGARVRVEGIKWGTPGVGVRWSQAPSGIKWGIKWAANGTYTSNMLRTGTAAVTPVRGVVVGRSRAGLAIGVRGGVVAVRIAVWLPGGKVTKALRRTALPQVGDTVLTRVRFGPRGILVGSGVTVVRRGVPGRVIPISGRISGVDAASRTMRISNVWDRSLPLRRSMRVPTTIDISRVRVGGEVATTSVEEQDGSLRVQQIAPNQSFAAANDPAGVLVAAPPADPATLASIDRAIDRWTAGRAAGAVPGDALYERQLARLNRARRAALDGDRAAGLAEIQAFIQEVTAGVPVQVAPQLAADVLAIAGAIADGLSR